MFNCNNANNGENMRSPSVCLPFPHYKQAVQYTTGYNTEENNGRPWSNCTKVGTLSQKYTNLVIL